MIFNTTIEILVIFFVGHSYTKLKLQMFEQIKLKMTKLQECHKKVFKC